MSDSEIGFLVLGVGAISVGLGLNVFTERYTRYAAEKAARASKRYAHRPVLLRPQIANKRPSRRGTRLTGLGFVLIGTFALTVLLTGNAPD